MMNVDKIATSSMIDYSINIWELDNSFKKFSSINYNFDGIV